MFKRTIISLIYFLTSFYIFSCKEIPPEGSYYRLPITMVVEDIGVTEIYLSIHIKDDFANRGIVIERNGEVDRSFTLDKKDTLIIDENLLPGHIYNYKCFRYYGWPWGDRSDESDVVSVRTKDTTSHNFYWRIDTFGTGISNQMLDAAILNDSCAYAVGYVNYGDTLYNLFQWDGESWKRKQAKWWYWNSWSTDRLNGIHAFSENDIWISTGYPVHYTGEYWRYYHLKNENGINTTIIKPWGLSSDNMYFSGRDGSILHYNGESWEVQETGNNIPLCDILGISNNEIYACGTGRTNYLGVILKYDGTKWQKILEATSNIDSAEMLNEKFTGSSEGVWMDERKILYFAGSYLHHYKHGKCELVSSFPGNCSYYSVGDRGYLYGVTGNASNDIIVFGQINTIQHFNGVSWAEVGIPYFPLRYDIQWWGGTMKGNVVVAVGEIGSQAAIITLWR